MHSNFRIFELLSPRVGLWHRVSMLLFMLALPLPFKGASAHEVRPAVADITVTANAVELRLSFNAEALLAGINLDGLADTDEADNVADYDRLRALSAEELATRVGQAWSEIDENIRLELGFSDLPLALLNVEIVAEPNPELPRETIVNARAPLPAGETPIIIGWAPEYGVLIVRQVDGAAEADALYTGLLTSGASSDPIPRSATATATATRSPLSTMSVAIQAGLQQTVPNLQVSLRSAACRRPKVVLFQNGRPYWSRRDATPLDKSRSGGASANGARYD